MNFVLATLSESVLAPIQALFWESFNILIAEDWQTVTICYYSKLCNQYCCRFYGSSLWSISGTAVQALCVDWSWALHGCTTN